MEVINIYNPNEYGVQAFTSNLNRITDVKCSSIGLKHYIEVQYYNQRKAMIGYDSVVTRNKTYDEWLDIWIKAKENALRRCGE